MKLFIILFLISLLQAKHLHKENFYQTVFCNKMNGIKEYVLKDRTRIDCLTSTYAIEVDFASKWGESIGQSLYYSIQTKRRPGILLIIEQSKDRKNLNRLLKVSKRYQIQLWTIDKNLYIRRR